MRAFRLLLLAVLLTTPGWAAAAASAANDSAAVTAARKSVDAIEVRAALESAWAALAPPSARLEIVRLPTLRHRGGEIRLEAVFPEDLSRPGPRAIPVTCREDGRTVARGLANVVLSIEIPVWTTARALRRGEELAPEDLIEGRLVLDREPGRLFHPEAGRRWRLGRDVKVGTRLRAADVRAIPDVEAGAEVTLVARTGQASVTVVGRVRRSGDVGDVILVHNPITGALVKARLVDGSTAELVTPERPGGTEGRRSS